MYNLGFFGSHNASLAISHRDTVLEVVEIERLLNKKNAALFYWGHHDNIVELLTEVKLYFEKKYGVVEYDNVVWNSVNYNMERIFPAKRYQHLSHHMAHAYCGLYQSPYDECLIISFDGGSDEGFFNVYIGNKNGTLKKIYKGTTDYAVSYMMAGHFIQDIKQEKTIGDGNLIYSGKLMGLCAYGEVVTDLYDRFILFYKSNTTDNIGDALGRFISVFSDIGITSPSIRVDGDLAKNLATTNQYVFEHLFEQEVNHILDGYPTLPVVIVGGCGLNILNNTKLARKRKVFVPPNPNDCGQSVGLVCSVVKPGKPVDCTYIGPEVWDRGNLSQILYERKGFAVNIPSLVDNIKKGKIGGIVRGRCEHGPRSLGNRSILCNPMIEGMKDTLNMKVKGREYYRPFAPIVRLEDVNKYFEWEDESRWMSFSPKVKKEYTHVLKSITHFDGTARVQTVTREQNSFIYDLLTEFDKQTGVGVLLNTSFNVDGKPILNTYSDALWVLDNKDIDFLVLEDYILEKILEKRE